MSDCAFCRIGQREIDEDLVSYRSESVFIVPALKQRPNNPGHALVLPVSHLTGLHDVPPDLLHELIEVTARVTSAVKDAYGATGSTVTQNNHIQVRHFTTSTFMSSPASRATRSACPRRNCTKRHETCASPERPPCARHCGRELETDDRRLTRSPQLNGMQTATRHAARSPKRHSGAKTRSRTVRAELLSSWGSNAAARLF
ncbi:HIT family protein [Streptomyces malaysiensis]|uniref:HIT family protein n=1 Tax=Streptomyces malaysiensis subsp. samsunensis TaxID=459658 RepID=A0A9X2LW61_STRMQ|nr:HIT family protein [Streptomyces samsunensis]MCQ8830722.1 HIT family protein [Streptomyces samsunensis]